MNKVTRNQHYVWRYYLRPWCECKNANKEIYFIWWNNKITRRFTNVFDILREIDFYQFNSLNNIEQFLLVNLFAKSNQKEVISANKDIIFLSGFISSIESIIGSDNTEFKKTQIKYGEEYQTKIEKLGFYGIDQLVKGDLSWISNQEKRTEFMLFICIQYFRTKAMKLNVLNKMNTESNMIIQKYNEVYDNSGDCSINWGNIYNYGLICLANNLCYNLLAKKMCFEFKKMHDAPEGDSWHNVPLFPAYMAKEAIWSQLLSRVSRIYGTVKEPKPLGTVAQAQKDYEEAMADQAEYGNQFEAEYIRYGIDPDDPNRQAKLFQMKMKGTALVKEVN